MAYSNILPRTTPSDLTGADLSGSDGTTDRTYTLPDAGVMSSGIDIIINGTPLHEGAALDFTLSGSVITFLNIVDNTDVIRINYWITVVSPSAAALSVGTSLRYTSVQMLVEMLGMMKDVPSWDVTETPTNEAVGTGDNSKTQFFLDYQNIVPDTYTLYANEVETTETTHYTLDTDTGEITLTSAGVTLLSTNNLTAKYKYIDSGMKTSYIIAVLSRAENLLDKKLNTIFTDGTVTNPAYPLEIEVQPSEGSFMDRFITKKKPLKDIATTLDGDITDSDNTLDVASGDGVSYPTSGYLIIGSEIITYTGITSDQFTGLTRGALGTTAAAHSDGDDVHSTIMLVSDTTEGTDETFTVQPWDTSMYVDENGLFYRFKYASPDPLSRQGVASRVKLIYLYGHDTVPEEISRLALLFTKRMLSNDTISKSTIAGRNEFRPEILRVDELEINDIMNSYIVLPMGNT